MKMKRICLVIIILLISERNIFSENIALRYVKDSISIRQKTQKKEDEWFREKKRLEAEYEKLKIENRTLQKEIATLEKQISLHKERVKRIKQDISKIEKIRKQTEPFLSYMYNRLSILIKESLPFLKEEREKRLKDLKKLLDDPSVSLSEKFRRLIEALFIEAEYGNTIEVYQERIKVEGKEIYANIFRLGRVALFFQSLDKKKSGYFYPSKGWIFLPEKYNRAISLAIDMAEKRRPMEIIDLPVGRIKR